MQYAIYVDFGEDDRKAYAAHWVGQTDLYGNFVKRYLGFDGEGEGEGEAEF
ncbi:hypothetical protein C6P42_001419 [Pichia californica]|nr:hypothetical protein C6P42_001419 [[Candida] californica]